MKNIKKLVLKNGILVRENVHVYQKDEFITKFKFEVLNTVCQECGNVIGKKEKIPNPEIFILKENLDQITCKTCSGTEYNFKGFGFLLRVFTFMIDELDYQDRLDRHDRRTGEDERDRYFCRNRIFHLC